MARPCPLVAGAVPFAPRRTRAAPGPPPVYPARIALGPPSWSRGAALRRPRTLVILPSTPRPSRAPIARPAASRARVRVPASPETCRFPAIRSSPRPVRPLPGPLTPGPVRSPRTPSPEPRRPFSAIGSPPRPIRPLSGRPAARTAPRLVRPPTGRPTPFPAGLTVPAPSTTRSGPPRSRPPVPRTPNSATTSIPRRPPPRSLFPLAIRVPAGTTSRRIPSTPPGRLSRHVFLRHYLQRKKVRATFAADDPAPAVASLGYLRSRV